MPPPLNDSRHVGFSGIRILAVAIKMLGSTSQNHVGILLKSSQDPEGVTLCHLYWHEDTRLEPAKPTYHWVEPEIEPELLITVATKARQIYRESLHGKIPYGFSPPRAIFDKKSGAFLFGPDRIGLTCATYVLAIFHSGGCPLVQYETWPRDRPEDLAWQRRMLELLRRKPMLVSPALLDLIGSQLGNERYRPEEVVGAVYATSHPAKFEESASPR